MKKILIASSFMASIFFAGYAYNKADTDNIKVSMFNDTLTVDGHSRGDLYISNRNDYDIKNFTIRCVGSTGNPNDIVEAYKISFNSYIPAGNSKTFKNEYLGHYSSKVKLVICVTVLSAQKRF